MHSSQHQQTNFPIKNLQKSEPWKTSNHVLYIINLALADLRAASPPKSRAEFYAALEGLKAVPESEEVKLVILGPVCANDSTKVVIAETLRAFLRNRVELSNAQAKDVVDGAAPMTIKINRENLTNVQSFLRECGLAYKIS